MIDYYKVLDIKRTATTDEVEDAFKRCARQHEGRDLWDGEEESVRLLFEARKVLSNPFSRSRYDLELLAHKRKELKNDIGKVLSVAIIIALIVVAAYCSSDNQNGDLDETFVSAKKEEVEQRRRNVGAGAALAVEQRELNRLTAEGWMESDLSNGQMPACYNFTPKRGNRDNSLEVEVGSNTDVVIKVLDRNTGKCIRYVYIRGGSTYSIKKIPEGLYYLKIAYGRSWMSKTENGKCVGKFRLSAHYEVGKEVLDFRLKETDDGYYIPSYRLRLDVVSSERMNSFHANNISEAEFNN